MARNELVLDEKHLSAILSLAPGNEPVLPLFRGREDVWFIVTFENYVKYINNVVIPSHDLSSSIYHLPTVNAPVDVILSNNYLLSCCLLVDCVQAVLKDMAVVGRLGFPASHIGWLDPSTDLEYADVTSSPSTEAVAFYNNYVQKHFTARGYTLPENGYVYQRTLCYYTLTRVFDALKGNATGLWNYTK